MIDTYNLQFAKEEDMDAWMKMVELVKYNFPGLDSEERMEGYKHKVIKNILRNSAICVKQGREIVGVLIFSYNLNYLAFMAVHPAHRRNGIASAMISKMLPLLSRDRDIWVSTFLEEDPKGTAPRALYKKFGFVEDEYEEIFDYPHQKFVLHNC